MSKRTSLQDIARVAGVSESTVSRVATGSARVTPQVAKLVRDAALRLGVDLAGRSKAKVIGFLLGNRPLLHPFHSRVLMAVDACCAAQQYNVMFLSLRYEATTPWRDLQVPEILRRRELIAGCILAGANSPNLLEFLAHQGMPFATFGNNVGGEWRHDKYDVVWLDDIPGAYQMTRFLRSLGHQDIWFVGNLRLPWFRRRFEGYRKAMQDTGLEPHLGNIDSDNYPEIGYLATRSILGRGERVSAIFAGSDEATRGVYKALADCGRSVPRDLSVAGFNDLEADVMHPPLTTVRTFPDQIGRQLAQMLLSRIVRPDMPLQQGTVPTEIVKRESHQLLSLPVELEDETLKAGAGKGSK